MEIARALLSARSELREVIFGLFVEKPVEIIVEHYVMIENMALGAIVVPLLFPKDDRF
jgi:hypothetical protein